jgi:hypothetical protein
MCSATRMRLRLTNAATHHWFSHCFRIHHHPSTSLWLLDLALWFDHVQDYRWKVGLIGTELMAEQHLVRAGIDTANIEYIAYIG